MKALCCPGQRRHDSHRFLLFHRHTWSFPPASSNRGSRWPTNTASRRLVSRAAERRKFCPLGVNIMLLMSTPETLIFIAAVVAARRDAVAADLIVDRERHT